jgi:TetR/AcrR family transcriptional repressor of bet genes
MMVEVTDLPRKASKDVRRQQLIEATLEVLAKKGYAGTTMADVAKAAGLSSGIVNFHFDTKENLLAETLRYLSDEYRAQWRRALEDTVDEPPAHRLAAVMRTDFSPEVCAPKKLAAWGAFWGESASRPTYLKYCSANDAEYQDTIERLCRAIIAEGNYPYDEAQVARGFNALTEGLWLDIMTQEKPMTPAEALKTAFACLHAFFPKHFGPDGPLPRAQK